MTELEEVLDKGFFISEAKFKDGKLFYVVSPVDKDKRKDTRLTIKASIPEGDSDLIGLFTLRRVSEYIDRHS